MRVGIVPDLICASGGIHQYSMTMLKALYNLREQKLLEDEFTIFYQGRNDIFLSPYIKAGWETFPLKLPLTLRERVLSETGHLLGNGKMRRIAAGLYHKMATKSNIIDYDRVIPYPALTRLFLKHDVDWMLYPVPLEISFETGIPYVMAVHDLNHRLHPEFPEVTANKQWEVREYLFRNGIRQAMLVLVDSEIGKEDVLNCYGPYGVTADRVKVLPFLPASYISTNVSEEEKGRVRKFYNLPELYLFYPAHFWPHKNHRRIVEALRLLREESHLDIDTVFIGSYPDKIRESTFGDVISLAQELGLESRIHYLGYVPEENMSALYASAVALVMPTFFGPTNIPPLEAWSLGCPVLTSDIRGIREQMGNAAILIDPKSVESIAEGIYQLWTDSELRQKLVDKGRRRLASYSSEEFHRRLAEIMEQAKQCITEVRI